MGNYGLSCLGNMVATSNGPGQKMCLDSTRVSVTAWRGWPTYGGRSNLFFSDWHGYMPRGYKAYIYPWFPSSASAGVGIVHESTQASFCEINSLSREIPSIIYQWRRLAARMATLDFILASSFTISPSPLTHERRWGVATFPAG